MTYMTVAGDELDAICQNYYGLTAGAVEQVYAANRDLADQGLVLPAGIAIELPELVEPASSDYVRLWT